MAEVRRARSSSRCRIETSAVSAGSVLGRPSDLIRMFSNVLTYVARHAHNHVEEGPHR